MAYVSMRVPLSNPSTSSFEYAQIWYESVLKNCRINKTTLHIDKPGKHTVKIICGDAYRKFYRFAEGCIGLWWYEAFLYGTATYQKGIKEG